MYRMQCVLALLVLYVGLAHSFSWDIVVTRGKQLEFYNEGSLTYLVPTTMNREMNWITYDPFHNRVLFAYRSSKYDPVFSFDIASRKIQSLIKRNPSQIIRRRAYDPATELFFGIIDRIKIYAYSLKPGSNSGDSGNLVINFENDAQPGDLAVDSCRGYIYWTTYDESNKIERVRFDGSEREVIIDSSDRNRNALIIDPQTQKMYWIETDRNLTEYSIESADLNRKNTRTLYREYTVDKEYFEPETLTVSKDFIYLGDGDRTFFWQLQKNPPRDTNMKPKQISMDNTTFYSRSSGFPGIATNYKIDEQIQGVHNCKALKRLLPNYSETDDSLNIPTDENLLCFHGTKVSRESRCECTQGYSGERCEVSVCHNYCFQGDCSVTAEGQPTCRCDAGYSGERCKLNACHQYCLNNGVCSLNEKSEPVCQCTGHYVGERCDVSVFLVKCFQTISILKDILNTDLTSVTLGKGMKSTCASTVV